MHCTKDMPCPGLAAMVNDGVINFTNEIKLPGFSDHAFIGFIMRGKTFVHCGQTLIDSHILNYCPSCGQRFASFIDGYAPPLVDDERAKKKPPESKLIIV